MKNRLALAACLAAMAAAPAFAQADRPYEPSWRQDSSDRYETRDAYRDGRYRPDTARVLESRPLYARGEARQECWNARAGHYEELREEQRDNNVLNKGTALGALVGGIVGHQVSSGTGGTVGGALLGGIAGNYINRRNSDDPQDDLDRTRCRVIAADNANPRGYEVRYAYRGQEYVTRLDHDPGQRVRLGRDVRDDGSPYDFDR